MSEILAFKILGGEEVVAEVVEVERTAGIEGEITNYIVRRPHILKFQQVGPNQVGLVFVPWTLANPGIVRLPIPASAVLLSFSPDTNVERQYIEQTSGLALA